MQSLQFLIVDDDALLGEQLRGLLVGLGHQAVVCPDAARALKLAEDVSFHLIFCDYWMSRRTGEGFYQQMALRRPDLLPRIVFLTGGVVGDETQFFIKSTGNLRLLKPLQLAAVKQVLEAARGRMPPEV